MKLGRRYSLLGREYRYAGCLSGCFVELIERTVDRHREQVSATPKRVFPGLRWVRFLGCFFSAAYRLHVGAPLNAESNVPKKGRCRGAVNAITELYNEI